ncbi:hypothetical protein KDN24_06330 [Bacillus sp. Bva_UNVM-123]|uniref:hypothetical protein n=1 Tax=Bacillus sp. Bva_UNVM-123 TaxID=2829798 RepID=UPI00391F0693
MNELKFALECGIKLEVKILSNDMVQVSWNEGKCIEIITIDEANQLGLIENEGNDYTFLISNLPPKAHTKHKIRLINFLDKHDIGRVYECMLCIGNDDIIGTVTGTKGSVLLRQYLTISSTGKEFFRMKVTKYNK